MLFNNVSVLLGNFLLFSYQHYFENDSSISRIVNDPVLLRDTLLISLCGAFGQIFIYLTISIFDNHKCAIITTSRKCLSVVVSNFVFGH